MKLKGCHGWCESLCNFKEILTKNKYSQELLKIVEINGDPKPFGRLWSDILLFDHINRPSVIEAFANAMSAVKLEPGSQELINFCTIISNIMDKYKKDQADKFKKNRFR